MSMKESGLTIQEVVKLTGLTSRTLRWYDELGLVVPDRDSRSDYRRYRKEQLKDLQQVIFLRELDFPLAQIKKILADPGFNRRKALEQQVELLMAKRQRMDAMLATIALALSEERGEYTMKDTERFQGFDFSHNPHEKEARLRWGDTAVDTANEKLDSMDEQQKVGMADSMKTLFTELAAIRHTDPASTVAQQAIGRWYELLNTMGTYTPDMFANLGRMYVEDQRFTQNIDKYGTGLARFMCEAMVAFQDSGNSNSKK